MKFQDALLDPIPLHEAAAFFVKIKTAQGEMATEEATMSSPGTGELEPTNYLQAEQAARSAQEENESNFYRQKLEETAGQAQMMEQQVGAMQQQLQGMQQEQAQAGAQMQQAQDEAARQTQLAANMRMGIQQMRSQMMEIASQDPETMSAQAPGALPPEPMMQEAPPQEGAPQEAPPEQAGAPQQEAPPPQQAGAPVPTVNLGGPGPGPAQPQGPAALAPPPQMPLPGMGQPPLANATPAGMMGMKQASAQMAQAYQAMYKGASALPMALGALVGAGSGAAGSLMAGRHVGDSRKQLAALQGESKDSFAYAMRLAKAKMQLAAAEQAAEHPVKSALAASAGGALGGAAIGRAAGPGLRRVMENIDNLRTA